MPDLYLKFMTPDIWDALVIAVILIGMALAVLRLLKDYMLYQARQRYNSPPTDPPSDQAATPPSNRPRYTKRP